MVDVLLFRGENAHHKSMIDEAGAWIRVCLVLDSGGLDFSGGGLLRARHRHSDPLRALLTVYGGAVRQC
ncbi:hypothetical protein F4558_004927 [Micromonospora profundi]|nr:hypothetical protein ADK66_23120 [Micromonospora sp. NRRL B-16802]NJC15101.1 hypothetical protein [Micromonospora profundi]